MFGVCYPVFGSPIAVGNILALVWTLYFSWTWWPPSTRPTGTTATSWLTGKDLVAKNRIIATADTSAEIVSGGIEDDLE